MKRRIIWVFSMVLWLLIFSSIFSLWVERTMTPIVTECYPDTTESYAEPKLPLDCLFTGEDGEPVLYQIYEGLAWESGTRVKLVPPQSYTVLDEHIIYYGHGPVIRYSTKELQPGEKAVTASGTEGREELYLAIVTEGVSLRDNPGATVLARKDDAILAGEAGAPSVFMPKRAAAKLFWHQTPSLPSGRVYSLVDVEDFFRALPFAAILPGMMMFALILWAMSFPLLRDLMGNRGQLVRNTCFAAALLVPLVLLNFLRLPPSLLPRDSIVDFSRYLKEFGEIFTHLRHFADAGVTSAQGLLIHAYTQIWIAAGMTALFEALAVFLDLTLDSGKLG